MFNFSQEDETYCYLHTSKSCQEILDEMNYFWTKRILHVKFQMRNGEIKTAHNKEEFVQYYQEGKEMTLPKDVIKCFMNAAFL